MRNRRDVIRKKLEKRRKQLPGHIERTRSSLFVSDEEKHGIPRFHDYESDDRERSHPLIRKDWFLVQIMAAICLFLIVGIMFKSTSPQWDSAKNVVNQAFEKEFQFAMVSEWYESQFGKPLAILPVMEGKETNQVANKEVAQPVYALPASGRVMEDFSRNGKGITIETGVGSAVEAIDDGFIVYAGIKEDLGKTIVIQHSDGSETWYGNLEKINVKLYDFVEARSNLGAVTNATDGETGTFYFAYKKGDAFIDPVQVIPFE